MGPDIDGLVAAHLSHNHQELNVVCGKRERETDSKKKKKDTFLNFLL